MRPLVTLLALLLLLAARQGGPGPSAALDQQPALGRVGRVGRIIVGPEGVGCAGRLDLGRYGFRTGLAAEVVAGPTPDGVCADGRCDGEPSPETNDAAGGT